MTVVRWIIGIVLVAIVALAAVGNLRPRPTPPTTVQTTQVVRATITRVVSGAGKLQPIEKVNVSSNITGTLVDLDVGIGSQVKQGQYLGQIDTTRYAAQMSRERAQSAAAHADVARTKASVEKLKRDLARAEELADRGAAGRSDLDQTRSAVRMAEAELVAAQSRAQMADAVLAEAKSNLGWATLKSPVDGTVLDVRHRVGERIRGSELAEDVILVLGSLSQMQVRIEVGEHDVVYLQPGQAAKIEIDALPDLELDGKVIDSGRDAIVKNPGTDMEVTTFPVWVSLDRPPAQALSGMSAQVRISTETRADVISVPIQAVTVRPPDDAGKATPTSKLEKVVFVVKDGAVEKRKVTTGLSSDALVEITSGLTEGEQVVEGPYRILARELKHGDRVSAKPAEGGAPSGSSGRGSGERSQAPGHR